MRENKERYQIRNKRKSEFSLAGVLQFISKRKFLYGGIAAAVVVVVVLFATGVFSMPGATPASPTASVTASESAQGAGSASPSPSVSTGPIKGTTIGVSVLSPTLEDYTLMAYFDKEANEDKKAGLIQGFIMSDAKGDGKRQLTQVEDMIKKGANVIVVMGTKSENFKQISDLSAKNNVKIVASNVDATQGFAVDVMSQANHALKFAQFSQQNGATQIYTVGADETEVNTIKEMIPVKTNILSDEATATLEARLAQNEPITDLMFFDNSANSVLKMYIGKGILPNTITSPAYVGLIKTWYNLMHNGVPMAPATSASPSPSASAKASASASSSASSTPSITPSAAVLKASPDKFHAIAYTKVQNLGEIVYRFALNLSAGRSLPQPNYVFDTTGEEYITNDNIGQYYAKIGKLPDRDILPSIGDSSTIDALFK